MGAAGAVDSWGDTRRATAQDRHARGDERQFCICCAPAALGAICPETDFSHAQRSTTSSASFSVSKAIWAELHIALREQMGREASPSAAVLDSQSIKSAEKGGNDNEVGYDAGKRIKGRKIHALVATFGSGS